MAMIENPCKKEKFPVQEFYFHKDRLGNITEITDYEGTTVQRYVYDAFGKVTIFDKDGNEITPESKTYLKNPYAFTGREYDPETGEHYYRERYLDSEKGGYTSEDPIGFVGEDSNLYRYVGNNPSNFVDPEGKVSSGIIGAVGLGFGLGLCAIYINKRIRDKGVADTTKMTCVNTSNPSQCIKDAEKKGSIENIDVLIDRTSSEKKK